MCLVNSHQKRPSSFISGFKGSRGHTSTTQHAKIFTIPSCLTSQIRYSDCKLAENKNLRLYKNWILCILWKMPNIKKKYVHRPPNMYAFRTQSLKFGPFVDHEKLRLRKNQNRLYNKLRGKFDGHRPPSPTSHHMLFARKFEIHLFCRFWGIVLTKSHPIAQLAVSARARLDCAEDWRISHCSLDYWYAYK